MAGLDGTRSCQMGGLVRARWGGEGRVRRGCSGGGKRCLEERWEGVSQCGLVGGGGVTVGGGVTRLVVVQRWREVVR